MVKMFNIKIIPWFLVVFLSGCESFILLNGYVCYEAKHQEVLAGQAISCNKTRLSDVHVTLRPPENPNVGPGYKAVTDGAGYYRIIGLEKRAWWRWQKVWEVVFEKEGYETVIVTLDEKKKGDPDSKSEYQYRVDAILSPKNPQRKRGKEGHFPIFFKYPSIPGHSLHSPPAVEDFSSTAILLSFLWGGNGKWGQRPLRNGDSANTVRHLICLY